VRAAFDPARRSLAVAILTFAVAVATSASAQDTGAMGATGATNVWAARARQASPPSTSGPQTPGTSPFLGGVPSGQPTAETLQISILDAISRALEHNLGVLLAEEQVGRARGARWRVFSALLPNVSGRVGETRQEVNLAAFGFPLPAGFPSFVPAFNVFDARVNVSQSIFDLDAINRSRAETHNVAAAEFSSKSARDIVVLVAANTYLQALAAAARADSARVQVETAEAIFAQAGSLKQSGMIAGIDLLRAEVQLNAERQRATSARNDAEKSRLQLARLIGLPIAQPFALSDVLPNVPVPDMTLEDALSRAYQNRADYQAALERVRAAEATRRAVAAERLPSVTVDANYGDIGRTPADAHTTFAVTGALRVPIFQGATRGRLLEADADLRNRRAEAEDLRAGIYYDVRMAFLDLQATREQLDVATKGRDLAAQQLTQARDRFGAGIANNIEVVQAQESVAIASEQYISALYGYNLAKGSLARGLGTAEDTLRQLLGGTR
jgi:outer membrane protein TolC